MAQSAPDDWRHSEPHTPYVEHALPAVKDQFSPLMKLAPFLVIGQPLAISIHARTNSDRRYAEQFSERVSPVPYEAVTESTGQGLIIIGAKFGPHPIFFFLKFLSLAQDRKLDPAVAARGRELSTWMNRWEQILAKDKKSRDHDQTPRPQQGRRPQAGARPDCHYPPARGRRREALLAHAAGEI